jgi:replicative DNA helicase
MSYVLSLAEVAHTTAYSQHYANEIKEKSNARKLIALADKISHDAKGGLKSSLDIISESTLAFNDFDNPEKNSFSSVGKFISSDFLEHIRERKNFSDRQTGFSNIDSFQLFEPGLYILGGTPACGKTTFAWQLLSQIAEQGEHCIFCSYEMSKDELVAKTLARKLFLDNPDTTLTGSQILRGGWSSNLYDIINEIGDFDNFIVREFAHEDVDKLLAILRPLVDSYDKPPIVCIDYLQRLIPRDGKADTRALIDDALFKLKDFSKKTNTTFIVISTFNRNNYNQRVSFESFKESGGIEYTADVVWALQLNIANYLSGEKEGLIRQKIDSAKKAVPREINVQCLKNRKGNNYDCFFNYFSAHDCFVPCQEFEFILSKPKTEPDIKTDTKNNVEVINNETEV